MREKKCIYRNEKSSMLIYTSVRVYSMKYVCVCERETRYARENVYVCVCERYIYRERIYVYMCVCV